MSRVARSARVGSRQRPEAVASSKTITVAESGEVYIISGSAGVTMTLPSPQEGSYYKFIYGSGMTQQLKVAAQDGDSIYGIARQHIGDGTVTVTADDGDGSNDAITMAAGAQAGSAIECLSDGSVWYAEAFGSGSAITFGDS